MSSYLTFMHAFGVPFSKQQYSHPLVQFINGEGHQYCWERAGSHDDMIAAWLMCMNNQDTPEDSPEFHARVIENKEKMNLPLTLLDYGEYDDESQYFLTLKDSVIVLGSDGHSISSSNPEQPDAKLIAEAQQFADQWQLDFKDPKWHLLEFMD
jgi:hypothetical protein